MNEQSQDLKELLLQTDEEFHHLAAKHHELDDRLHELTSKPYLSEPEQLEEVTLKKRKLQSRIGWRTSATSVGPELWIVPPMPSAMPQAAWVRPVWAAV